MSEMKIASATPKKKLNVTQSKQVGEIARLRAAQKAAIEAGDFDTAEAFAEEIKGCHKGTFKDLLTTVNKEFRESAQDEIGSYLQKIKKLGDEKNDRIRKLRKDISVEFSRLRMQHIHDLTEIDTDFTMRKLRQAQKTTPGYEELLQQAKDAAKIGNFEEARDIQRQATAKHEVEVAERITDLDKELKVAQEALMETQKSELEKLAMRLTNGILVVDRKTAEKEGHELEASDARLVGSLGKFVKRVVVAAPSGYDAGALRRQFENVIINMREQEDLPKPKGAKVNPPKATVQPGSAQTVGTPRGK